LPAVLVEYPSESLRIQAAAEHNGGVDDASGWFDQLPAELAAQRRLLERFLAWCDRDADVRWLTIGCSLVRGNADWMSDLDIAVGVREEHLEQALGRVRQALADIGDLVDSYDYLLPLSSPLRRFFAQYRDRTQVDLTVGSAPAVNLANVVVLYDPDRAVHVVGDEALDPKADEPRVWACQAWEALANVGKYVRRSSYWEAEGQLHEARDSVFRLWAFAERVPQARYGLTALVDAGARMPPGIDNSVAGASVREVLGAARCLADLLIRIQHLLSSDGRYELPDGFGTFVAADLVQAEADCPPS
jgi:predicted nucleotidyltransferase